MIERRQIVVQGAVQGVGYRPFVYQLAQELGVGGWVANTAQGVVIEAEAERPQLEAFLTRIRTQKPPHAILEHINVAPLLPSGAHQFEILPSDESGSKTALILPDLAICADCLREILDPENRRYRYPFTNCTHCGPRFSIIQALPYDRASTTMCGFAMCDRCRAEYENPLDRRFHAQPNACPDCGPQLSLWDGCGQTLASRDEALVVAAQAIRSGRILAVKGLGGFHLMADARNAEAVAALRARKGRRVRPFALMFPSLDSLRNDCAVSEDEAALLQSAQAPIVLLHRKANNLDFGIAANVAPGNPNLGAMLPYTPLHCLLLNEIGFPIVATSGNLSGEPICTDEREALQRLGHIADLFLVHDRPIERHVDDSIVRVMAGREMVLRRARGYAPLPIELPDLPPSQPMILATGAHLKNMAAITVGQRAILSQHIGDMETLEAFSAFKQAIASLSGLYESHPAVIACDLHPDYRATQFAQKMAAQEGLMLLPIQHHYAHILACMGELALKGPVLGVAWDGTGYGTDGTIWGGEFLRIAEDATASPGFERVAHLRPFRLPGGDTAVEEPRRAALGLLYELYDAALPDFPLISDFSAAELAILKGALRHAINAPYTSSAGRLFDAVAAITGLCLRSEFEGQAAMSLEFAAEDQNGQNAQSGLNDDGIYPFSVTDDTHAESGFGWIIDWQLLIEALLADLADSTPTGTIAVRFHNTLAALIVAVAEKVGLGNVVLSGGCFQNKLLLERTIEQLATAGFHPYWPRQIPANDGGIALGQLLGALHQLSPLT
ncbi:MAG TPA: carbamoyltransferase HypF [Aggregatilineales bacterium]|nr:carbamoyltransferase HypF [Aggregatilineales bacterium]